MKINIDKTGVFRRNNTVIGFQKDNKTTELIVDQGLVRIYSKSAGTEKLYESFRAYLAGNSLAACKQIDSFKIPYLGLGKVFELNNGHKIIFVHKGGPTVIRSYVKAGAFNEPHSIKGISHLIEHLVAKKVEQLNNLGVSCNASTSTDCTQYYLKMPFYKNDNIEKVISVQADMFNNFNFTQQDLDKEKKIVLEEMHQADNKAEAKGGIASLKNFYNVKSDSHPVTGDEDSIKNIKLQDIKDYFNNWYTPENITTVIIGDLDEQVTLKLAGKYFGKAKKHEIKPQDRYYTPYCNKLDKTKRIDITDSNPFFDKVKFKMDFAGPKNAEIQDSFCLDALKEYINETLSLRLKLKEDDYSNMSVCTYSSNSEDPQIIHLEGNFDKGEEEKGLKRVYEGIYDISQNGISEKELEVIKSKLKQEEADPVEDAFELSRLIGYTYTLNGNTEILKRNQQLINSLTVEDIKRVAKKYLDLNKASIVMIHPESKPADSNKAELISFKGVRARYNTKNIKEYDLKNNIRLVFNPQPDIATASITIRMETDLSPVFKDGTGLLLWRMLGKGTKKYPRPVLRELVNSNNIKVEHDADNSQIELKLNALPDKIPVMLELAKETLQAPELGSKKYEVQKKDLKELLTAVAKVDSGLNAELFTTQCRTDRTLKNLDKITNLDVINLYDYIAANSKCHVTVTLPESLAEQYIGSIITQLESMKKFQKFVKEPDFKADDIPLCNPVGKTKILTRVNKENDQANITQAFKVIKKSHKDKIACELLSIILGETENSRLYKDLRERQGLAYSVSSDTSLKSLAGKLELDIQTNTKDKSGLKPENIRKALESFRQNIQKLVEQPVSQEELDEAKERFIAILMGASESSQGKNMLIENGVGTTEGVELLNKKFELLETITVSDIQEAARTIFHNKNSVIYVKASKEALEQNKDYLRSLGEIKELDSKT